MSRFLRAAAARADAEREARLASVPVLSLRGAPETRRKGHCACGEVALLGADECRGCRAAACAASRPVSERQWRLADVVAVVRRLEVATADDVMEQLECCRDSANSALSRAVQRGLLRRVRFGEYAAKETT